jgi:hypothetical protein
VSRSRWAAIGAAVAVSIGGGGIGLTHAISTNGGNTFVPIAPCRLFDTRSGSVNVGPRATPLGAAETYTQQVTGNNGQCTGIPADATAVSLNVTTLGASASSYLTVFPADVVTVPNASNLNWLAAAPPTPNKVDVKLSPSGAIKLFNLAGTVNVLADVVGYYQDHNHDDRYARKLTIAFSVPAGGDQSIEIPAFDVPLFLTGSSTTPTSRGTASVTLLVTSVAPTLTEWNGLESTWSGAAAFTSAFAFTPNTGTHIVFLDYQHTVDVQTNGTTAIRIHNANVAARQGTITLTW